MAECSDRELLKQQRKQRKKEKKEKKRLENEKNMIFVPFQRKSTKISLIRNKIVTSTVYTDSEQEFPLITQKGFGRNKHIASTAPVNVPLDYLIIKEKLTKKVENRQEFIPYNGNCLDSSHPVRFQGKHREEPKKKRLSKLKSDIVKTEEKRKEEKLELKLMNYCDNAVTVELNEKVTEFIRKIVTFQEHAYKIDPTKAKIKKRYIAGFHEIKKHLLAKRIEFLVIAADIKIYDKEEPLFNIIYTFIEIAKNCDTPYIFALKRAKIGRLIKTSQPVSCLGVLNCQGAETELKNITDITYRVQNEDCKSQEAPVYENFLSDLKEVLLQPE